MTVDVFISYRGADRALARRLEQRLRSRWGSRVFRDETGLLPGQNWADLLNSALRQARVVIAMIGPGWTVSDDPTAEDWVRTELIRAIEQGTPVLPVLVGDPDQLRPKLAKLPAAFGQQAVRVTPEMTGIELRALVQALSALGAFARPEPAALGSRMTDLVPPAAIDEVRTELREGRSVLLEGHPGCGRTAVLRAAAQKGFVNDPAPSRSMPAPTGSAARRPGPMPTSPPQPSGPAPSTPGTNGREAEPAAPQVAAPRDLLVGTCDEDAVVSRRTHAVIAGWLATLGTGIRAIPNTAERARLGRALVGAVISHGPDLISRRVVSAGDLLAVAHDGDSSKILEAARRSMDRWAPYPPHRLVNQGRGVLEEFAANARTPLLLVAPDIESVDGNSLDLLAGMLENPIPGVQLLLSAVPPLDETDRFAVLFRRRMSAAAQNSVTVIRLDDPKWWGVDGVNVQRWLAADRIELEPALLAELRQPSAFLNVAQLWYLADNGYVVERSSTGPLAVWGLGCPPAELTRPTKDDLFDHLLREQVPLDLLRVIDVGALVGRTFPFEVVAHALELDDEAAADRRSNQLDADDEPVTRPSARKREQLLDRVWQRLCAVDTDGLLIACSEHRNRRTVTFVQSDLPAFLRTRIPVERRVELHGYLAQSFQDRLARREAGEVDAGFQWAESAASHWIRADEPRRAADAHRLAAELAEAGLAYREARENYRSAIRIFTQVLADTTDTSHDHEDLLILANCSYRLGQMVRLSGDWSRDEASIRRPDQHYEDALTTLAGLERRLLNRDIEPAAAPVPDEARNLPRPDLVRHHLRLAHALSGYVSLELAAWYKSLGNVDVSRNHLFETLRFAEAARGEGASRWLLAAASARLAEQLADEAFSCMHSTPDRARQLAVEASFHIERVIGLAAITADEDRDLAEPRSWARRVQGRLFQRLHLEPRLAEWAYREMNRHSVDIRAAVDMDTDRALAEFLLSTVEFGQSPSLDEAGVLLGRFHEWATESGVTIARAPASLSLMLWEITRSEGVATKTAELNLDRAGRAASDDQRERVELLGGFFAGLRPSEELTPTKVGDTFVGAAFARAKSAGGWPDDVDTVTEGWRRVCAFLLAEYPRIGLLAVERASHHLGSDLSTIAPEIAAGVTDASEYLRRLSSEPTLAPTLDRGVDRLAAARLPERWLEHGNRTAEACRTLFAVHGADCELEEGVDGLTLERDLALAAKLHDWYRSVDASRMLTLATEWNLEVTGIEWANPLLLHGRLAVEVLRRQFDAERQLGNERFRRIATMIEHHTVGRADARRVEQLFVLADAIAEYDGTLDDLPDWIGLAHEHGRLDQAYETMMAEKTAEVFRSGRIVDPRSIWSIEPAGPPQAVSAAPS